MIPQPIAVSAKSGQDFGLKLIAMDHPLNLTKQLAGETLILINIREDSNTSAITEGAPFVTEIAPEVSQPVTTTSTVKSTNVDFSNGLITNTTLTNTEETDSEIEDDTTDIWTESITIERNSTTTLDSEFGAINFTSVSVSEYVIELSTVSHEIDTDSYVERAKTDIPILPKDEKNSLINSFLLNISSPEGADIGPITTVTVPGSVSAINQSNEETDQTDKYFINSTANPIVDIFYETFNETETIGDFTEIISIKNFTDTISVATETVPQNVISLDMEQPNPILINIIELQNEQPLQNVKIKATPKFQEV